MNARIAGKSILIPTECFSCFPKPWRTCNKTTTTKLRRKHRQNISEHESCIDRRGPPLPACRRHSFQSGHHLVGESAVKQDGRGVEKAVIPAAGFGTRMRPISQRIPKEMLRVGAKPMIQHVI